MVVKWNGMWNSSQQEFSQVLQKKFSVTTIAPEMPYHHIKFKFYEECHTCSQNVHKLCILSLRLDVT